MLFVIGIYKPAPVYVKEEMSFVPIHNVREEQRDVNSRRYSRKELASPAIT